MNEQELELVRSSLRNVLATTDPATLHTALIGEGWADLFEAEPAASIDALAREAGAARCPSPVTDIAALSSLGLCASHDVALVLPPFSRLMQPAGEVRDGVLVVDGMVWPGSERADRFVVLTGDEVTMVSKEGVNLIAIEGFDPALGLSATSFEVPLSNVEVIGDALAAADALGAGRRSLSAQLLGASRRMLAETVEYVAAREQYGRAIGSFQSVKHRLADVYVATTAGDAALAATWANGDHLQSMAAKALAGTAHELASRHCQQVQGGIAFTVEHGFHNWVRRGHILDAALGRSVDLTRAIGRRIRADATVPRVPVLY